MAAKKDRVPAPPDGGYGWVVLVACFMISFVIDGCMYSFGIILGDIKNEYQVSQEKANLLASLNTGFLFCSGPVVSGLSQTFGIRPVVMGGAVVTASVYVLSAYAPNIYIIMVFYGVIGGISTGCTYIASLIVIAEYFDKLIGVTTGITMAGSGVGAFAFAQIAQLLISNFDWKFTLIVLGCIIIQCAVMGALLRPGPTKPRSGVTRRAPQDPGLNVQSFTGSIVSVTPSVIDDDDDKGCLAKCGNITLNILKEITNMGLLVQNIGFLFIALSNLFLFSGFFLPFLYIPIRAKELEISNASLILGMIGLINIPARLIFGFLADARFISPVNLNTMSVIVATIMLWVYPLMNSFGLQLTFSVLFAIGAAGMNCLTTPYLKDIVGIEKFSNAMGITNLFRGFGCFIGPFAGGFISEKFGSSLAAFFFSSVVFSIGSFFALLVSIGIKMNMFKNIPTLPSTNKN